MVEILLGKFNKSFFIKKIGRRRPAGFDRTLKLNFKNHLFSHFLTDFGEKFFIFVIWRGRSGISGNLNNVLV